MLDRPLFENELQEKKTTSTFNKHGKKPLLMFSENAEMFSSQLRCRTLFFDQKNDKCAKTWQCSCASTGKRSVINKFA